MSGGHPLEALKGMKTSRTCRCDNPIDLDHEIAQLEAAAEAADTAAMNNLGYLCTGQLETETAYGVRYWHDSSCTHDGVAVPRLAADYMASRTQDLGAARLWFEDAAASGNGTAMCNLGVLHAQTGDTDEALRWLGRAADADCDKAMYILGLCQASTTPPDLDDALRWYERAAEAGSSDAMYALAAIYMKKLKPRNKKMAKHWYGRAVEAGRPISPDLTYQVRTFMGAVRTAMKALG